MSALCTGWLAGWQRDRLPPLYIRFCLFRTQLIDKQRDLDRSLPFALGRLVITLGCLALSPPALASSAWLRPATLPLHYSPSYSVYSAS